MRPRTEAGQGPFIAGGDPVPMPRRLSYLPLFASVLALLFALRSAPLFAQEQEEVRRGPRVIYEDKHDTSLPLRTMLLVGPQQGTRAMPLPHRGPGPARVETTPSVIQPSSPSLQVATTNALSVNGIGSTGFAPPDPNASVGSTQVVETVNDSYQVFNKSTGASQLGPVSIGNLWVGFGGICETGNLSDPVVLFDKAAGRWVIAIVAFDSLFSNNAECIAVSTSSDATGSFNRYALSFGSDLNDYTKMSVWPDAYYLSANIFPYGGAFVGPAACGSGGTCIPQRGTSQQLDTLGERLMFRLAYRNFGNHESLVATHSITSGSSTAVRWYEIRSPNATPAVYQSGTFAPDASSRWMPSIAMDKAGDIALGYSVSSSTLYPSIAYTGRVPGDALGTMDAETTILTGLGSQTGGLSRWGDYTSMAIDPADDCTFWYDNQYQPANGSFNWTTRLASFSFPSS